MFKLFNPVGILARQPQQLSSLVCRSRLLHTTGLKNATTTANSSTIITRNTEKPLESRKTFLIDYYKSLFENNEIVLFVHRNNLIKQENDKYRADIADCGANFTVIKNSLMKVYLKNQHHPDPASKAAKRALIRKQAKSKTTDSGAIIDNNNPLIPLLKGPTGIITIKECDPKIVNKLLKFLKTTNEKLFLIGGKVEQSIYNIEQIDNFKKLPNKQELQAELVGILTMLSGAGLVQILQQTPQMLYLTLKGHEENLTPSEEQQPEQQQQQQEEQQ